MRTPRKPHTRRELCQLTAVHSRNVTVIFRRLPARKMTDAEMVLEFRPYRSKKPITVKLADIFKAKMGNVELAQALDGVEAAVGKVRDARQFHFADSGQAEVLPFPLSENSKRLEKA